VLLDSSEDRKCNGLPIFRTGLLGMVPTLVVASNRQPRVNVSLSDPNDFDPSRSSAALWEIKVEVHPDTPCDDPAFRILGASRPYVEPIHPLTLERMYIKHNVCDLHGKKMPNVVYNEILLE
jgi:hypothetical protein